MPDENQTPGGEEKPRYTSPESEAASVNQPKKEEGVQNVASTQATKEVLNKPKSPNKIGKESKKSGRSSKFILGCLGGLLLLFALFIALMVLVVSQTGADSPVMRALGIDPAGVKNFLLLTVNLAFGLLSLLFLVLMVIGIFRLGTAKKGDKVARKKGLRMFIFSLLPLIASLAIWVLLFNFISRIQIQAEQVIAEVVVVEPADTGDLQAPVEVTFSSENAVRSLQLGGLQIQSVAWDLDGDGEYETRPSDFEVVQLYTRRGSVNVGLRIQVAGEETPRVYNKTINIEEAIFAANPSTGTAPLTVQFDAGDLVAQGAQIRSIDWDFDGDGAYELTGPDNLRPRHTFEQIGLWEVHLRIVNAQNNVENYYRDIEIVPSDTPQLQGVVNATPSLSGTAPFRVRFDAGESVSQKGTITGYEWDFGDGTGLESGRSVSHTFQSPGEYDVTLTVEDSLGQTAERRETVTVSTLSSKPEIDLSTTPAAQGDTLTGDLPFEVNFDVSQTTDPDDDIVTYEWDFEGDGTIDNEGTKVSYTYETEGTYEATITVTDAAGNESAETLTIVVNEPGVRADIQADPEEGVAPLIIEFDGSSSSAFEGDIVSYEWDFGDGSPKTITGATISHKYNEVGTYTVNLKVVTNRGESAETSQIVYVREIPLRACFTPSRSSGSAPLAVSFDPQCSTGSVSTFTWDFGDGDTSATRKPSHTFEDPGTYTVTLEVADDKNNVDVFTDVIVAEGEVSQ